MSIKKRSHNKINVCLPASECFITVNTAGDIWIEGPAAGARELGREEAMQ